MILLLLACGEPEPASFEDCAQLSTKETRTACRVEHFEMPKGSGDLDALLDTVQPDEERDLLIIELAVANPQTGSRLCPRVKTSLGERQCQQVLGRPHLGAPKRPAPKR